MAFGENPFAGAMFELRAIGAWPPRGRSIPRETRVVTDLAAHSALEHLAKVYLTRTS